MEESSSFSNMKRLETTMAIIAEIEQTLVFLVTCRAFHSLFGILKINLVKLLVGSCGTSLTTARCWAAWQVACLISLSQ